MNATDEAAGACGTGRVAPDAAEPAAGTRSTAPPPLFCAAPWLEAVVRMDGRVLPCCRSDHEFGSLAQDDLGTLWRAAASRGFREHIAHGRYPSAVCAACHRGGKQTSLHKVLDPLLGPLWLEYDASQRSAGGVPDPDACQLMRAFHAALRQSRDGRLGAVEDAARALLRRLEQMRPHLRPDSASPLDKLARLLFACLDYCRGELRPRVVATLRQVSLVAVCNARCLHCVGLYTDEIRIGQPTAEGRRKRIDQATLDRALDAAEDVTAFFLNGSEFFLYPQWRTLLQRFERDRIRIGIATNGLLMDAQVARVVAGSRCVRDLNFSFDGATADTVERLRRPVRFDPLCASVTRFLQALDEAGRSSLPVALSMVLMRSNRHEAEALVRLTARLARTTRARPHVSFQVLDANAHAAYAAFRASEYTDLQDPDTRAELERAARAAHELGIDVQYTYLGPLQAVLSAQRTAPGAA